MNKKITHKELKRLLSYDPDTGICIWKVSLNLRIKIGDRVGCISKSGYGVIRIYGINYQAHVLIWFYMEGYWAEHDIDHWDRNRSNNKWDNLRHVTPICNSRNKSKHKNNTSGVTGIRWHKRDKKWTSQISVNRKQVHLGYFICFDDAVRVRWQAEVKYEFPNCNSTSTAYKYLKENNLFRGE